MTICRFALAGFLMALLGALLPGWNYHLTEQHSSAGWLFFALAGGVITSELVTSSKPLRIAGCALSAAALISLSFLPPPFQFVSQFGAWLAIGFGAGLIRPRSGSFLTQNGIYSGAGCLLSVVLVAAIFNRGYNGELPGFFALVPVAFGITFFKEKTVLPVSQSAKFSTAGAIVLATVLLFQAGGEWTLAGWLPLFLTHRLGISPATALWILALFWLTLVLGRVANLFLMAHIRHGRIVLFSAAAALLGCALLVSTDNAFGATAAIILLGGGLTATYPLLAAKMGSRFTNPDAAGFNNIFSLALSGGLLFPWVAGLLAQSIGLTAIVAIPAICVIVVAALSLVLWLESTVTGR